MFLNFLDELRAAGIPASLKEHLILLGMAALAGDPRPVGVRHHHHARGDHAADDRDMAERQACTACEHDHRADLRRIAAAIMALGLVPPGPGIAVYLDARRRPRERHALADIIEQRCCLGWCGCQRKRGKGDGKTRIHNTHADAVACEA